MGEQVAMGQRQNPFRESQRSLQVYNLVILLLELAYQPKASVLSAQTSLHAEPAGSTSRVIRQRALLLWSALRS